MKILYCIFLSVSAFLTPVTAQWSVQPSGSALNINSVSFVNENTGYAAGDNARIFKTTNGGQDWSSTTLPGLNFKIDVITARDPNSALATGRNSIFMSTNGGKNWAQTDFNPSYRIMDLYEHQNGNVYASAYEYNNTEDTIVSARILLSTNYGNNWTEVSSIAIDESGVHRMSKPAVVFVDNNTGYLATLKGIYKTTNAGNSFTQLTNQMAWVIDAQGPQVIYAGVTNGSNLEVIRSTNQGANWVPVSSIPNGNGLKEFSGMRLLPTVNKIYLTVSTEETGSDLSQQDSSIYVSWDNGSSWFFQQIPTATNIFSIDFIDGNTGWLAGSGGTILKTTNGGGSPIGIHVISTNVPGGFSLFQNYPNPFNPMTNIKYQMPNSGFVSIKIFDVLGEETAAIVNQEHKPGIYEVNWDASGYPSGIYFYRMHAMGFTKTMKMILIK